MWGGYVTVCKKHVYVCSTILHVFWDNYRNCMPQGAPQAFPRSSLFCDRGGGVKSWRWQALFQGRHCFCPTPTLGVGGPVKEAGTHSPPCPQYPPNIKPHAMQSNRYFTLNLFPHKISA